MTTHTVYRTFRTRERREWVRITDDVAAAVRESGVREGMVLVSAMHITAGVWIHDDEPGIANKQHAPRPRPPRAPARGPDHAAPAGRAPEENPGGRLAGARSRRL